MKYNEKLKFCKSVNSDSIYQEYAHGIRCSCFRDVNLVEHLEVMHFGYHSFLQSTKCNDWDEDHMLEWIMCATNALKEKLGLVKLDIPF